MLIDETSVWKNPRTGLLERVFPSDFAPAGFRSVSPSMTEIRDWMLGLLGAIGLAVGSPGRRRRR